MIYVNGGNKLRGQVAISGAKNSLQFLITSALLTDELVELRRVPIINDLFVLKDILTGLNCEIVLDENQEKINICTKKINSYIPEYLLMRKLRSSLLFIPGLLHRFKKAYIPLPGGDEIGNRPLDTHFYIIKGLGGQIIQTPRGYIILGKDLKSNEITLPFPSFTGTGMAIMLASKISGTTVINNIALEPEIQDLVDLLNQMGVEIKSLGKQVLSIKGKEKLKGATIDIMPDRLEVGTLLMAAVATKGEITFNNNELIYLESLCDLLLKSGCIIKKSVFKTSISYKKKLLAQSVETNVYPAFPTDLQPQLMALMTQFEGRSIIKENLFNDRFQHVPFLSQMGAQINVHQSQAYINGITELNSAKVKANDIRGGASLIIAALVAQGITTIDGDYHIERGYSKICNKLQQLGADINKTY